MAWSFKVDCSEGSLVFVTSNNDLIRRVCSLLGADATAAAAAIAREITGIDDVYDATRVEGISLFKDKLLEIAQEAPEALHQAIENNYQRAIGQVVPLQWSGLTPHFNDLALPHPRSPFKRKPSVGEPAPAARNHEATVNKL